MAINNENEVLHRVLVKLHPNYLLNVEGAYIARTDSEASLTIEEDEPGSRPPLALFLTFFPSG